jgi:hypothetical protein
VCVQQWRPLHIHAHMRICALVRGCMRARRGSSARERLCACLCLFKFAWFRPSSRVVSTSVGNGRRTNVGLMFETDVGRRGEPGFGSPKSV